MSLPKKSIISKIRFIQFTNTHPKGHTYWNEKDYNDNLIDPLYNKNAYDYDDNFEICIEVSNDFNIN